MARKQNRPRKPSAQAVREFRHGVAVLKSKGLVSKKVDARKQRLTRYMKAKVKNYEGVISGREAIVWREPEIVSQYVASGKYKAAKFKKKTAVIVPKEDARDVRLNKAELLTVETRIGNVIVEKVILPVSVHNMDDFLREAMTNPDKLDKLKKPDQLFGFTYYGHKSTLTYPSIDLLAEDLAKYRSIENEDVWENFVLVRVRGDISFDWTGPDKPAKHRSRKATQDRRYQTFRFQKLSDEEKAERHREEERRRRERLRKSLSEQDKERQREKWKLTKRSQRGGLKRKKT